MPDSWDTMDARLRDAWVAERVMGWRWITGHETCIVESFFVSPEEYPRWTGRIDFDPSAPRATPHDLPNYTTDPTADYAVLCRVRETWDWQAKRAFCQQLHALMCEVHLDDDTSNMPLAFACYAPGLYSRAAYEVLSHESETRDV